ncbi:MAG TPA: RNA polymerase sigma factor [Agriterribacter sp.]|nr:RNA polymerase sigma factor [Agriterribacter sp.]
MELIAEQDQYIHLVKRCQEGDVTSFKRLYEQYAKAMYNTSLRILNNSVEAEDVLQESFIDAFHHIGSFQNKSSFGAWIKQIVVNKSINQLKKKRINLVEIEQADLNQQIEYAEEDKTETQWQVALILNAIKQLPPGYRTVLSLYLLEGYDHEEIAQVLGVSESTVRTQYIRAKQKLLTIIKRGA